MKILRLILLSCACLSIPAWAWAAGPDLSPLEDLGRQLFFDTQLSNPPGQACASCHDPNTAFTDSRKGAPTSPGVLPGRFGNRNTPTAMYAAFSPTFHFDVAEGLYIGGQFNDGRAADLEAQAKGPFLNPLEMANPNPASVVAKVRNAGYAPLFEQVFGSGVFADTNQAYSLIASAIAAFERTSTFAPFSSKYDAYLAGKTKLSPAEERGLAVYEDPGKGNCAACHPNRPSADGTPPVFTDFSYDNLGTPRNPSNPFYALPAALNPAGWLFADKGLGQTTGNPSVDGAFKVPTLRNIQLTAPYTHNGYFTSLKAVVEFYNDRDTKRVCPSLLMTDSLAQQLNCWPQPEVTKNVNRAELGNLKLNEREINDLVAFLGTLTDGYGDTECLFDWLETQYPNFIFPPGAKSQTLEPYNYRHYTITNSYVGVSSADNHLYYLGPNGILMDVGGLPAWLEASSCAQN